MADPITPNFEYSLIDGQVVTLWVAETSTGGTKTMSVNLPTYAPWIDTRIGHPVLNMLYITNETDNTGTEVYLPEDECERGATPDSGTEWVITDYNTVNRYKTADHNGHLQITYIAFGGQRA